MPDAGRQMWGKWSSKRYWTHLIEKIEVSKSIKKSVEKRELREMDNQKRDKWKHNEKWSFMKWSLVKITLKHNLGLLILSFGTPNPALHYML